MTEVQLNSVSSIQPWQALVLAVRLPTLLAGIGPVLIGISLGIWKRKEFATLGEGLVWPAIAAVLLVVLLQAAANLVNDAKDAEKGVDSGERLGPLRVVQSGLLSVSAVRQSYRCLFALAGLLVSILFAQRQDWLIPLLAIVAGIVAYAYTAGPYPLAYFAMGEVLAGIFFGPFTVMGTVYLLTGKIFWDTAYWGLGSGFIAAAIMAVNNFRDRDGDALAGKKTIANLVSSEKARQLPLIFALMSLGFLLHFGMQQNKMFIAGPWTLLGFMFIRRRIVPRLAGEGAKLNEALQFTAIFNVFYALMFASLVLL